MTHSIRLTDIEDSAIRDAISGPLGAYNVEKTGRKDFRPLVLVLESAEGSAIGGLWGRTAYGWLFVRLLFVPDALRGKGVGTELMYMAEREAKARGCHSAWLDTFEFQARGFYERLGYTCFAQLPDYPPGFSRFFMKKVFT
jgi:GNAT superfamily N-acetyltransferase